MPRLATFLLISLVLPGVSGVQPPKTVTRESTTTATVDRIERSSRVVTLRGEGNVFHSVYVEPTIKEFDTLKVGDVVTVRYTESVIVQVRPNAKPTPAQDTTDEARKTGGANIVEQQQKITVTIESIDSQRHFVTYRTHDNRQIVHAVRDKSLLDGIRAGDRVEITMTRARAVSIERARR